MTGELQTWNYNKAHDLWVMKWHDIKNLGRPLLPKNDIPLAWWGMVLTVLSCYSTVMCSAKNQNQYKKENRKLNKQTDKQTQIQNRDHAKLAKTRTWLWLADTALVITVLVFDILFWIVVHSFAVSRCKWTNLIEMNLDARVLQSKLKVIYMV